MIKTLFKDVAFGRVARLSYLGHSILLFLLLIAYMLIVVLAIGAGEHIIGGDLQQAQDQLRGLLTLPFLIVTGIVMGLLMFAGLNIMAKRIRDIGLPGWWMVLALIVLGMLLFAVVHFIPSLAPGIKQGALEKMGEGGYKGISHSCCLPPLDL